MKLSKRRMEVLEEYGVSERGIRQKLAAASTPKKRGRPKGSKNKLKVVETTDSLTPTERRKIMRELEESVRVARRKKDRENELAEMRREDRESGPRRGPKVDHALVPPHRLGQMSAGQAKREERGRWLVSSYHAMNTSLISQNLDTGIMTWHGEVCVHCGSPPKNIGEVMLAQFGPTEFICTDCGKHMPHQGTGLRGYTSGEVYRRRQKIMKLKPTPKWRMPIVHTYQEEEED